MNFQNNILKATTQSEYLREKYLPSREDSSQREAQEQD
jgi:hypothetical protein